MVPLSESAVVTGYLVSVFRVCFIPWSRSISTPENFQSWYFSGMNCPGLFSSFSRKIPSLFILALACLSAEHETPIPTGHDAPWRGSLMTLTSRAKCLPPNCAPIPISLESWRRSASSAVSRNALPCSLPDVGSSS